jgi:hypothetical protein
MEPRTTRTACLPGETSAPVEEKTAAAKISLGWTTGGKAAVNAPQPAREDFRSPNASRGAEMPYRENSCFQWACKFASLSGAVDNAWYFQISVPVQPGNLASAGYSKLVAAPLLDLIHLSKSA